MNKQNMTCSISRSEIKQFFLMLESGIDIETMIKLIFKDGDLILVELKNGKSLNSILCENQKGLFFKYLNEIGKYTSLKKGIGCVESIESLTSRTFKSILKKIAYPYFLMIFALAMIVFFSDYVLVEMSYYLNGSNLLFWISVLKFIFFILFIFISLYFVILYIMLYKFSKLKRTVHFFLRYSLFKKMNSLQFVCIYSCLLDAGLTTIDILTVMKHFDFCAGGYLANSVLEGLNKGLSFEESVKRLPYIDDSFKNIVIYAMQSNLSSLFFHVYIDKCKNDMDIYVKKISIYIHSFSYLSIGALVLIVYQVMLLPLNMLNQF